MRPLADGIPRAEFKFGRPPDDGQPFAIYGQTWTANGNLPRALAERRPVFLVDNGYWMPGRGLRSGYYRITYRGLAPIFLKGAPAPRARPAMRPWRKRGRHVLIAMPGDGYGSTVGLDMTAWKATIVAEVTKYTDRPIRVRDKPGYWERPSRPLAADLSNCWALVTHSSNVAVDAVLAGVPVIVAETNPAAPVGVTDLARIEEPICPDRDEWWASLLAQQYMLPEMRGGFARDMLQRVTEQVDGTVLEALL